MKTKPCKVGLLAPCHPLMGQGLSEAGYEIVDLQDASYNQILNCLEDVRGIVVSTRIPIDSLLLKRAPCLRWIARLGSGLDHISLEKARDRDIVILSSPEGNAPSVANHCLGLLLNATRNITASFLDVKDNRWDRERYRGRLIQSMTIGIIGYGHTGTAFAALLNALGVRTLIYDKYKTQLSLLNQQKSVSLDTLQRESDAISIHIPLHKENTYFINGAFFSNLAKKPIIINTSRGGVVDSTSLLDALQMGHITYACLDVLENEFIHSLNSEEQEQFDALLQHKQVLITPHIAGWTRDSLRAISEVLLKKIIRTDVP